MPVTALTLFDKLWQLPGVRHPRVRPGRPAPGHHPAGGVAINFQIDSARKHRLLNGLDDIALTLQRADRIRAYEARRRTTEPWLFI